MFTKAQYDRMHELVFRPDYSGYKPSVIEIPNGDGKADSEKRYAHIATKYFTSAQQERDLMPFLEEAHEKALQVGYMVGLPNMFMPRIEYGALRVLDYPPGAVSHAHEDFDLFTLMMYRDRPDRFRADDVEARQPEYGSIQKMRDINPQAHLGQLGQEVGLGKATLHWVLASDTRQKSIVYFAIPDHNAVLPSGVVVRDWLNERMQRSRTEFRKYE